MKLKGTAWLSVIFILFSPLSCKKQNKADSATTEGWDYENAPALFGVKSLRYDQFTQPGYIKGAFPRAPWTDTYWPTEDLGLAYRWINPQEAPSFKTLITSECGPGPRCTAGYWDTITERRETYREALKTQAASLASQGWQKSVYASPAEKYSIAIQDPDFQFLGKEFDEFFGAFRSNQTLGKDADWRWMGYCHGWAPASYLFEAPKHAVMVTRKEEPQVLFTEGDIRGLLTKAFADLIKEKDAESVDVAQLGGRCTYADNLGEIPRDPKTGRILDALLGSWPQMMEKSGRHVPLRVVRELGFEGMRLGSHQQFDQILVQFGPNFEASPTFLVEPAVWSIDGRADVRGMRIYEARTDYRALEIGRLLASADPQDTVAPDGHKILRQAMLDAGLKESQIPTSFTHFVKTKACRDVNAGSFHVILTRFLGDAVKNKRGLVIDVTRDEQVWNQAIASYESVIGEKTPILDSDKQSDWFKTRAKGTTHIAQVYTHLVYAYENGPKVSYQPRDEATRSVVYHYTLDLDADGYIIGGEWHRSVPAFGQAKVLSGDALKKTLSQRSINMFAGTNDMPDFVWAYPENLWFQPKSRSNPDDPQFINPDVLKKIYECSREDKDLKTTQIKVAGERSPVSVRYKNCSLD